MDITHGMNVAEVEALGRALQSTFAPRVQALVAELDRTVSASGPSWRGADGDRFRSWWTQHRGRVTAVEADLREFGRMAATNAADQRGASAAGTVGGAASATGSGTGTASSPRPLPTRLDSLSERQRVLNVQSAYLRNSRQRTNFPSAFAEADSWLAELQAGEPTPGQVAAFESYMATLKFAALQQDLIEEAANHAYGQFAEAAESGASAVTGPAGLLSGGESGYGKRAMEEIPNAAAGLFAGAGVNGMADGVAGLGGLAAAQQYRLNADAAVSDMAATFRRIDGVGYQNPNNLVSTSYETIRGRLDMAEQRADFADAFNYVTGDGSVVDTGLRTGLWIFGGPVATTVDAMGVAGNVAQTKYHLESGADALGIAGNGVNSLYEFAEVAMARPRNP